MGHGFTEAPLSLICFATRDGQKSEVPEAAEVPEVGVCSMCGAEVRRVKYRSSARSGVMG